MGLTITKTTTKPAATKKPPAEDVNANEEAKPTGAAAKQVQNAAKTASAQSKADKTLEAAKKKEPDPEAAANATETIEHKTKGTTTSSEEILTPAKDAPIDLTAGKKQGDGAEVFVESSYTHNLGDYKSVKVGCSLKLPCNASEVAEVFDYASTFVSQRMTKMMISVGAIDAPDGPDADSE